MNSKKSIKSLIIAHLDGELETNDLQKLSEWILKGTTDYQETKDEYKYFRVLSGGRKYFYASPEDYFEHNKNHVEPMYVNVDNKDISVRRGREESRERGASGRSLRGSGRHKHQVKVEAHRQTDIKPL